jgi:hypothetical protein
MRRVLLILAACVFAAPAFARPTLAPRHVHHRHHVVAKAEPNFFERLFGAHQSPQPVARPSVHYRRPRPRVDVAVSDTARPRDCYGIAWCGCWLRHHLGIDDVRLNLARAWSKVGEAAAPAVGVIVVWAHHVGIITGHDGTNWVVTSGNDGHAVRTRPRSLKGAIAFRKV